MEDENRQNQPKSQYTWVPYAAAVGATLFAGPYAGAAAFVASKLCERKAGDTPQPAQTPKPNL